MKYFRNCKSLEELKQVYRRLAKEHHPDRGGSVEEMTIINNEYDVMLIFLGKKEGKTDQQLNDDLLESEAYRNALNSIIHLEDLIIELCGNWLWISGNTREHKEILKQNGFRFASKKCQWYFRTEEYSVKGGKSKSLEEIREKYGSKNLTNLKPKLNKAP